jgi:hypothetical protein
MSLQTTLHHIVELVERDHDSIVGPNTSDLFSTAGLDLDRTVLLTEGETVVSYSLTADVGHGFGQCVRHAVITTSVVPRHVHLTVLDGPPAAADGSYETWDRADADRVDRDHLDGILGLLFRTLPERVVPAEPERIHP